MTWLEITIETTREGAEAVSALLLRAGAAGTVIEDKLDLLEYDNPHQWDMIDEKLLASYDDVVRVKCYFPQDERISDTLAYVRAELGYIAQFGNYGTLNLLCASMEEADWANAWKKHYKPFRIGRFLIKPTWEAIPATDALVLEMDPGMAFGTGMHESTAMCLAYADELVTPDMRVLDVGCGSGILGIAAALIGAQVLCIDLDPVAVSAAQQNIALNRLQNITAQGGDLVSGLSAQHADLVFVNIIADVIIALLPALPAHIAPGGRIVVSGIISDRLQDVRSAALQSGFAPESQKNKGEWHALCLHSAPSHNVCPPSHA